MSRKHKAVAEDEIVWCEIPVARDKPRVKKIGVVVDPGWLVHDSTSGKLAHENAWIEVAVEGMILTLDPTYIRKTSLLEKIAFAASGR